ncbi:GntR family transcriptional regulator [Microbacterium sp. Yaish 1]|uniref:GntR family transcriptional regulator n=1 Tax=Microbacterium sp. Yaish 1 TaxID=2025014 RepID=UPI000B93CA78|nr:GntR family transcriptional regulator [Microbacterium sp. Yaish 1]OYC96121.1 GntR family transcriptional regulator [Microbacterium sp. Yaish 1]
MTTADTVWPESIGAELDRTGPVPLYFQVSTRLEHEIRAGNIAPGARLENEIAIAERLGLSRPTIRRAIQELVDKGLLVRRRGVGTQVVQGQVTRQVELTSLYEDLDNAQQGPATRVLEHEVRPADPASATALGVAEGSDILYLRRQRLTGTTPIAILENYLPADLADLDRDELEQRGLYQLLRARGIAIRIAKQKIGARRAEGDEHALLGIERGGPVLTMERIAFDNTGRAIEFGHHCYRPDMYTFETTVVAR